jgi:hypothetical protein
LPFLGLGKPGQQTPTTHSWNLPADPGSGSRRAVESTHDSRILEINFVAEGSWLTAWLQGLRSTDTATGGHQVWIVGDAIA